MLSYKARILALLFVFWLRPGVVSITHGPGCLYVNSVLYRCYAEAGAALIGGKNTDGAYRPAMGSVFTLVNGAHTERARAMWRVWVPAIRR